MIYEVKVIPESAAGEATGSGPAVRRVEVQKSDDGWKCLLDGTLIAIDVVSPRPDVLSLIIDGRSYEIKRDQTGGDHKVWVENVCFTVQLRDPRSLRSRLKEAGDNKGPARIVAPMPGRVVRILVAENHAIEAGEGILVVEAMKMQNEIKSPKKGVVKKIATVPGTAVNPGDVLAIVE